MAVKLWE